MCPIEWLHYTLPVSDFCNSHSLGNITCLTTICVYINREASVVCNGLRSSKWMQFLNIFTMQRYPSAAYAMAVCLSLRLCLSVCHKSVFC